MSVDIYSSGVEAVDTDTEVRRVEGEVEVEVEGEGEVERKADLLLGHVISWVPQMIHRVPMRFRRT